MFAILISEKGGAERRETFDQSVVTIGRVQDNDLPLSKGNVSKRHCRLECSPGRFIVIDEDSTNGTYVNRRRITQPTAVRAGDRIYVGDFVLRLEDLSAGSENSDGAVPDATSAPAMSAPAEAELSRSTSPLRAAPSVAAPDLAASVTGQPAHTPHHGHTPQEGSQEQHKPETRAAGTELSPGFSASADAGAEVSTTAGGVSHLPAGAGTGPLPNSLPVRAAARSLIEEVFRRVEPRVLERALDREATERLERILVEQANQLASLGHALAPEQTEQAVELARSELMGLGPLAALVEDESVFEIIVTGASSLFFAREGSVQDGVPFCHPRAVEWVIGRLCRLAGLEVNDSEPLIQKVLKRPGFELHAVRESACATGALLRLKRWRGGNVQLDDLVQVGTLSRAMATFLRHCVMARANVMIVGRRDSGSDDLLGALAGLVARERATWLSWNSAYELPPQGADFSLVTVGPDIDADALLSILSGMGQRVAAAYPTASGAKSILLAAAAGLDGLLVLHEARTSDAALTLISHQLASPELSAEDIRSAVGQAFDVVVEVVRLGDGRSRVMRIAEPTFPANADDESRGDIFKFVVERTATGGSIEGSFTAPARAPTLLKTLRARGIAVEEALVLRPASD